MLLSTVDIALRAASIGLLLLIAAVILRDFSGRVAPRVAAALAAGSAAYAVASAAAFSSQANVLGAVLASISAGNIIVFWLFVRTVFDDAFELCGWHLGVWVCLCGVSLVNCLFPAGAPFWPTHVFGPMLGILSLAFIALAIAQTISTWSDDLVERRRQSRAFVVAAAAGFGVLNAIVQLLNPAGRPSELVSTLMAAILLIVVAAIALALLRLSGEELFDRPAEAEPATNGPAEMAAAERKLAAALHRLMTEERVYRREGLSIGNLATRLTVPEYRVRRLINGQLGYRNFNAYLNSFRIAEARAALADPDQAEVPVTTIALDAGFQSIGPFNRAFKLSTGLTPSDYRREKLAAP